MKQDQLSHLGEEDIERLNARYCNILVLASPDCPRKVSEAPTKSGTIPWAYFEILKEHPYEYVYSDLLVEAHVSKLGKDIRGLKILEYNLRKTPLCKTWGWGIHGDSKGRLALIPQESERYRELADEPGIKVVSAFRRTAISSS